MKSLYFLVGLALLCLSCETQSPKITYTIGPQQNGEVQQLRIHLTTPAGAEGESILSFPDDAWGEVGFHATIADIKVLNEEATVTKRGDSGWIVIEHRPGLETLEVEYVLEQDFELPVVTQNDFRPIIQPDYFHVFSHNLFMLPAYVFESNEDEADVQLEWQGFPEDYVFQNSFGRQERSQLIEDVSENEFHTAIFAGGDLRSYSIDINGNEVAFGLRDNWEAFQDSTLVDILSRTITAQRDFWEDHSQKYFSVSMIPTAETQGYSYHGTGLTNSFAMSASNNEYLEVEGLVHLMNHELQHNWIGHVIKNDNEEEQYWFSEGFTEYYTLKNIANHSIYGMDANYFITEFNRIVRELYSSPVGEAPNSDINYDNFWSSREYSRLPYIRGAVFAFYLDHKIQQVSEGAQSLDDLMLTLKEEAEDSEQLLTHNYFLEVAYRFLNEDLSDFFYTHIEQGKLIDLEQMYSDFGMEYEPETQVFDLGFTFGADEVAIATVDPESEAYKAGLRVGDTLAGRSIWYGNLTKTADFNVIRDGVEFSVSYVPVAVKPIPQLKDKTVNKEMLSLR